jgi:hypothetical protein
MADPVVTETPVVAPAPVANWFDGLEPELKGHVQNKGWDKLDIAAAAVEAVKAHREAQKHLGVPAEQLIRLPRHDDLEGQKALWQRLGAPEDASGYDLSGVKFADGSEMSDEFAGMLKTTAAELNLPAGVLPQLATKLAAFFDTDEANSTAAAAHQLAQEKDALSRNWGPDFDTNVRIARAGAETLGLGQEFLVALEKSAGYAKAMEGLLKLGHAAGSARHLTATLGGDGTVSNPALASREQALARIEDLKVDKEFGKRWMAGDAQAVRELEQLHVRAYGRGSR